MTNTELINHFYTSFVNGDANAMTSCYHVNIIFKDPVFGTLNGNKARNMWKMLLSRRSESTTISFNNIKADGNSVSAQWTAQYNYGESNRKVINNVTANFKLSDGKIIEHTDSFDLWKWTKQALGLSGYLLGWTGFMQRKIQQTTNAQLKEFMSVK